MTELEIVKARADLDAAREAGAKVDAVEWIDEHEMDKVYII